MSVINKMLRDLDSRRVVGTIPDQGQREHAGIVSGTLISNHSGAVIPKLGSLKIAVWALALLIVLSAGAGAWWYLHHGNAPLRNADLMKVDSASVKSTPVMTGVQAVEPVVAAVPAHTRANVAREMRADSSLKMDMTIAFVPPHALPAKTASPDRLQAMTVQKPNERPMTVASNNVPATVMEVPRSPPRRSPAMDALAHAQQLWSAGSRDAAIDLVSETLAVAESANLADSPSDNHSVLASLARELARMELAEGRVSQALSMLVRLEPALSGFADIWAMRGNAAQRLGRHEESASAYLAALKLRPDEPRWMLGAAVSLAAQGKTASAADLAEKARAGGVLSPEVVTYLRQLGVAVREH